MTKKRYTIVRVDNSCPTMSDGFGCIISRNMLHCKCGEDAKNYGDTKEQLVMKVAQVIAKCRLEKESNGIMYSWEDEARKIIEFLGVEECKK